MNESFFCLSDMVDLFKRKKNIIFFSSFIAFIFVFLFFAKFDLKYTSYALFQDGSLKKGVSKGLESIIFNNSSNSSNKAASFFKTQKIIKQVVEKLALQIEEVKEDKFIDKYKKNFILNYRAELNKELKTPRFFYFQDAKYEKTKPTFIYLRFLSKDCFEVLDENHFFLTKSNIQEKIKIKDLEFSLVEPVKNLKLNQEYKIKISPWIDITKHVISKLKIISSKDNTNLLNLSYPSRDKKISLLLLDTLMQTYIDILKKENDEINNEQLNFLKEKKENLLTELNLALKEYEDYLIELTKNSYETGLDTEISALLNTKKIFFKELEEIDKNIICLEDQIDSKFTNDRIHPKIKEITQKICDLNNRKDQISFFNLNMLDQKSINKKIKKLKNIQDELDQNEFILKNFKNSIFKNSIFSKYNVLIDTNPQKKEFEKHLIQRQKDLHLFKGILNNLNSIKNIEVLDLDILQKKYLDLSSKKDQITLD